jgi:hypothetical protein
MTMGPDDFSFDFRGDGTQGTVSVVHQGRSMPGLRVINENSGWTIDER